MVRAHDRGGILRVVLMATAMVIVATSARSEETLVLEVTGAFEERPGAQYFSPATALVDVTIPARGWFHSVTEGSPGIFGGPDGNSPFYHFSTHINRVGVVNLTSFTTTDIEVAPVIAETNRVLPEGGVFAAQIVGPAMYSFTFGDFIYGDPQSFVARGFFDPSPVADAGPAIIVEAGAKGRLLGAASDVDDDALTYDWARVFGPSLGISSTTELQPTFTAPAVGSPATARYRLIVSDAHSDSLESTVDVLIYPPGGNIPPLVNAGADQEGDLFDTFMLTGAASTDFDGTIRHFSWTQLEGPIAVFGGADGAQPTFRVYDPEPNDRVYVFELVVSDGQNMSAADTVVVTVAGFHEAAVPVGPNETLIFEGQGAVPEVTQMEHNMGTPPASLEITGVDVPGAGRLRTEVLGSPALFNGPDGNNPHFHFTSNASHWNGSATNGFRQTDIEVAPIVANTYFTASAGGMMTVRIAGPAAISYTFLDYLYGEAQAFDVKVWFRPANSAPTAEAGEPITVYAGRVGQLDGRGSTDPDTNPLRYQWRVISGSATLSNAASPVPLITAATPQTVTLGLVVSDGAASSTEDTTTVEFIAQPLGSLPIAEYLLGMRALTPEEIDAADFNNDGAVNVADLIALVNEGF